MMKHAVCVLPLALAAACVSTPVEVESDFGIVTADDARAADLLAAALAIAPRVKEAVRSTRGDRPHVRCVPRIDAVSGVRAICTPDHIEVRSDALPVREYLLAHELVHWYLPESPYEDVPYLVEEGVAEYIALELLGWQELRDFDERLVRQAWRESGERVTFDPLYLGVGDWVAVPIEQRYELMCIGLEVVRNLGLERVRELAEAGAGVIEYVTEAKVRFGPVGFESAPAMR